MCILQYRYFLLQELYDALYLESARRQDQLFVDVELAFQSPNSHTNHKVLRLRHVHKWDVPWGKSKNVQIVQNDVTTTISKNDLANVIPIVQAAATNMITERYQHQALSHQASQDVLPADVLI